MTHQKRKILIVEDEEHARYLLERLLTVNNFEVQTAEDGIQALKMLSEFSPQIILADWSMPNMDGAKLCEKIKSNPEHRQMYFILLTAKSALHDKVTGLDTGADDYVTKPVENDELLARIRSGLRIYDLQLELKKSEHDRALLEMAATLGHQMNNPLSAFTMAMASMRKNVAQKNLDEIQDDIGLMNDAIKRMQEITSKLSKLKEPSLTTYLGNTKMLKI
jgi:sigma-B regulation protein RsbU (phosphoserine phosphatase)